MTTLPAKRNIPFWVKPDSVQAAAVPMPENREIVIAPEDRWEVTVSRRPLPATAESILTSGLDGDLSDQHQLFNIMVDTWPKLSNNLSTLKRGASQAPFCVHAWTDMDGKSNSEADRRKRLVEHALWEMQPDESSMEVGAEGLFEFLAEGTIYGHSVAEILWHEVRMPDGTLATVPRAIQQVDPIYYGYPETGSIFTRDRLMMKTERRGRTLEDFPENKFLVQIDRAHRAHPSVSARIRALTKYWLGGTYGWEWLLVYAQLFGSPFRWANYDPTNPQAKTAVCSMLANMGNSGWGAFPAGTELKFVEASKSGGELPQALVTELAEIACDLLILGHTQQTKQNAGSRATEVARSDVRKETLKAVCSRVASTLTQQFAKYICYVNFGNYDYIPEIRCDIPDAEATADEVSAFKTLQDMGTQFPAEWIHGRYGIPIPGKGDVVLKPIPKEAPASANSPKKVTASDTLNDDEDYTGLSEIYARVMQYAFADGYNRIQKLTKDGDD